ncbi:S9 family peptidase, partial [Streptomyces sp. NPDC049577]
MRSLTLPRQFARTRRFTLGVPSSFTLTPDGTTVLFLRSRSGHDPVTCLWALDADSGRERLLVDPAEAAGEPGAGIAGYATDDAARLAAFVLAGAVWTVDVADGRVRRLPTRGPAADPRPDPAGRRVAYASRGALRVFEADGSA